MLVRSGGSSTSWWESMGSSSTTTGCKTPGAGPPEGDAGAGAAAGADSDKWTASRPPVTLHSGDGPEHQRALKASSGRRVSGPGTGRSAMSMGRRVSCTTRRHWIEMMPRTKFTAVAATAVALNWVAGSVMPRLLRNTHTARTNALRSTSHKVQLVGPSGSQHL